MIENYIKILLSKKDNENKYSESQSKNERELFSVLDSAISGNSQAFEAILEVKRRYNIDKTIANDLIVHPMDYFLKIFGSKDSYFKNFKRFKAEFLKSAINYPNLKFDFAYCLDSEKYIKKFAYQSLKYLPILIFESEHSNSVEEFIKTYDFWCRTPIDFVFCNAIYYLNDISHERKYNFQACPQELINYRITDLFKLLHLFNPNKKLYYEGYELIGLKYDSYFSEINEELEDKKLLKGFYKKAYLYKNNQINFSKYSIENIFHKWFCLFEVVRTASEKNLNYYLQDRGAYIQRTSKYSIIGKHLVGLSIAVSIAVKETIEKEKLNVTNEVLANLSTRNRNIFNQLLSYIFYIVKVSDEIVKFDSKINKYIDYYKPSENILSLIEFDKFEKKIKKTETLTKI